MVHLNLYKKMFWNFLTKKCCNKGNFHPSRDAALLYSRLHGPHGLVFTWFSEISWDKSQLHAQEQTNLFVSNYYCLLRWTTHWIPLSLSFVTIWVEFYHNLSFRVLLLFEFCCYLSFVSIWVLTFVTIWVFKLSQ